MRCWPRWGDGQSCRDAAPGRHRAGRQFCLRACADRQSARRCCAFPYAGSGDRAAAHASGRIDHLAIDIPRRRLFVAELGNGSVDVVDLDSRTVIHRISSLDEPQGVVFMPKSDLIAVASGGDGTVRMYRANDFVRQGVVKLGADADNLRPGADGATVVAGYGSGGLAVIDPVAASVLKDIPLPGHPEGFQLASSGARAYVNVPDAHRIVVVDMSTGTMVAQWGTAGAAANFPMTLGDGTVAVALREPARADAV